MNETRDTVSSSSARPGRKRRWLRWMIYAAATFAVLLIALAIAVPMVVSSERVRTYISGELSKRLDREVTIGKVTVGLFQGVVIDGLVIKEDPRIVEGDFVRAERVQVKAALLPLLWRTVKARATLSRCQLNVVRLEDGRLNAETLVSKPPEAGPPSRWTVLLSVTALETTVRYDDRVAKTSLVVSDIAAAAGPLLLVGSGKQPPLKAELSAALRSGSSAGSIAAEGIVLPLDALSFKLKLKSVPLTSLLALASEAAPPISGGLLNGEAEARRGAQGQIQFDGKLTVSDLALSDAPGKALPEITAVFRGSAMPDTKVVTLDSAKVESPGVTVEASGTLMPDLALKLVSDVDFEPALAFVKRLDAWPAGLQVKGSARSTITMQPAADGIAVVTEGSVKDLHAEGPMLAKPIDLPGDTPLSFRARVVGNSVLIESFSFHPQAIGLLVSGDGRITPPNSSSRKVEMNLKMTADLKPLLGLARGAVKLPDGLGAEGAADITTHLLIHGSDVDCSGEATLSNVAVTGLLPDNRVLKRESLKATFDTKLREDRLQIRELTIDDPALAASLKGEVTNLAKAPKPKLDGTFTIFLDQAASVAEGLIPKDLKLAGETKGTIQIMPQGEATGFKLDLDATAPVLGYADLLSKPAGQKCLIAVTGVTTKDAFDFNPLSITLGPSTITGRASLARDFSQLAATLSSDSLDIGALAKLVPSLAQVPASGTATLKAQASANLRAQQLISGIAGTFNVQTGPVTFRDYQVTSAKIDGKLERGKVLLQNVLINAFGGEIRAEGEIDFSGEEPAFKVDTSGEKISLKGTHPLLKFPLPILGAANAQMDGLLNFSADLSGQGREAAGLLQSLKGVGRIGSGSAIRVVNPWMIGPLAPFRDFNFDTISGEFDIGDGRIVNDDLTLTSEKLDVLVKGYTDFDGPIHYAVTLKDKDDLFGGDLQKLMQYISSDKSITLEIGGTMASPKPQILSVSLIQGVIESLLRRKLEGKDGGDQPAEKPQTDQERRDQRQERLRELLRKLGR